MRLVTVDLGENSYNIYIGNNLQAEIVDFCKKSSFSSRGLIITDTNVGPLYGDKLKAMLADGGVDAEIYAIEAGESSKSLGNFEKIMTRCIELGLDRKSPIFALGGGVVGDLAGFAAASYMRGVPFVQVPTSLLAQVDSSVGGKVAVNHTLGKNLIGAFYQPKAVFMDLDWLRTLPKREIYTGLGEIIKYGIIYDNEFFRFLEENVDEILSLNNEAAAHMTARSCEIKAAVVSEDEKESGLRAILNFGHTMAHAVEKNTGYTRYNHGEAVAIGMICAAHISRALRLVDDASFKRVEKLIGIMQLPAKAEGCDIDTLYEAIFHDKKTVNGQVKWVLMDGEIGKVRITKEVPEAVVKEAMSYCLA
ncbi:3-dehydroquinate synthase [Anaerovibrio sp. JC8]|uniref:3-dehydroquinate synthase n=1 Tax=Anaerovibrio sp. JC8 TaxID=1240085 RepID=UPI000A0CB765|nr:3-dehydroquinate synthase [Anaerovibrio sp. JC8]ORT99844.1 3-dehydroquinate synthase [Anaerovibrio sp. JC8]